MAESGRGGGSAGGGDGKEELLPRQEAERELRRLGFTRREAAELVEAFARLERKR